MVNTVSDEKPDAKKDNDETEDEWAKWRQSGVIAKAALNIARPMVKPGTKVIDIVESVEKYILENASGIAFPCNVALNSIAAH